MSLATGTRLGPYEILAPLGAGGMGEVYRARDNKLGREVALKVLPEAFANDPERLARFEREARAIAALSHPNILAIHDFGCHDGVTYTVTELLEGETLRQALAQGPLPMRKAVEYGTQIAQGLAAAHDKGIVHRDLKPENLFVTRDGRIKILDFGLARQQLVQPGEDTRSPTIERHTDAGTVLGTVGYMSPEQVRGQGVDARSDIFALGCVLHEMLTGRRAFQRDTSAETMTAILREDPPEPPDSLPSALIRLVQHCLEKLPEGRFRSAHDIAFDLQALSSASGGTVATASPVAARTGYSPRIAALMAAALAGGLWAGRMLKKADPVEQPTFRPLAFDRGAVGSARFVPDGSTVVYNAAWRGEPTEIFATRLDSHESRSLGLREAKVYAVSSAGELAIGLEANRIRWTPTTLARVPLAGGAPREILDKVLDGDWSPEGNELAVAHQLGDTEHVEWPIGKSLYETKGWITDLRVSPKGNWIAFSEHPESSATSDSGSLVVVDRTGAKRVLSAGWQDLFGAAWRPDGREIWFTASKNGEVKALYAVTLDGKERLVARMLGQIDLQDISRDGRVLLTRPIWGWEIDALSGTSSERDLTWLGMSRLSDLSEDGTRLLFSGAVGVEPVQTYVRRLDGTPAIRLGEGLSQALSPDGKWALALRDSPAQLVLLPTRVGEAKTLKGPGLTYLDGATWFSDSRRVLFVAQARGERARIYLQDIDQGEPKPIGAPECGEPRVSPNGKTLVASTSKGVILVPLDGDSARPLAGSEPGDRPIRWSADGHAVFIAHSKGIDTLVFRLEQATGRRTLLWKLAPRDPAGQATSTVVRLTPDGKSYAYSFLRIVSDLYLVEGLK